ncbi:MAG TPA: peptide chain release factor 1 [Sediminispirochaeta sp.]|nr:peptide chain release factor 1 [Sediminispirochaeta sp.]
MIDKLEYLTERFQEVERLISDPNIMKDLKRYKELMQEHSQLRETVDEYQRYKELRQQIEDAQALLEEESDQDMLEMAKDELEELKSEESEVEKYLKALLIPKDPLDGKDIIMEIRAGTGGEEAALFAADLYRMYSRYAEQKGWKLEVMNSNETGIGGFKEIVFSISGKNVYENLRYESGVHRVQRIPSTESGGRIHTSAVTVAVLPEAEETDIEINTEDLKIDVFRSSGPGGQSVNTTDSAVRVTHLPTGTVVTCQDEKSQHKNKAKALRVLRSRLYEVEEQKNRRERAEARKNQIGSGDRSERIRTYNFPQNRVSDHRINLTLHKLDNVMQGELEEIIEELKYSARQEALEEE